MQRKYQGHQQLTNYQSCLPSPTPALANISTSRRKSNSSWPESNFLRAVLQTPDLPPLLPWLRFPRPNCPGKSGSLLQRRPGVSGVARKRIARRGLMLWERCLRIFKNTFPDRNMYEIFLCNGQCGGIQFSLHTPQWVFSLARRFHS